MNVEKGVTMKVSKKVLLLTAIMGMTWFGIFADNGISYDERNGVANTEMNGVASEERNGVSGVSGTFSIDDESEERRGVSAVSSISSIDDESEEKMMLVQSIMCTPLHWMTQTINLQVLNLKK